MVKIKVDFAPEKQDRSHCNHLAFHDMVNEIDIWAVFFGILTKIHFNFTRLYLDTKTL